MIKDIAAVRDIIVAAINSISGEITRNMRAITIIHDTDDVLLNVYYDGPYTNDEEEEIDVVVTNIISFLPESCGVNYRVLRLDEPEPLPEQQYFLYLRKESRSAKALGRIRDYQVSMWRELIPDARSADRTARLKSSEFPICPSGMGNPHRNTKGSFPRTFGMTGNFVFMSKNKPLIPVTDQISRQDQILLCAICAMLGELSYNVMGITQNNRDTYIVLSFYFETELSAADIESVDNIKNNLSRLLSERDCIQTGIFLVGAPGRTPVLDTHIYRRRQYFTGP